MKPLKLMCPSCDTELPHNFHKKLNGFWTIIQHEPCPKCSAKLQWGKHLHEKILRWGSRIRVLTLIFITTVFPFAFLTQIDPYFAVVPFILIALITACFIASSSKLEELYLEEFTEN